jgi:hypothetical protein
VGSFEGCGGGGSGGGMHIISVVQLVMMVLQSIYFGAGRFKSGIQLQQLMEEEGALLELREGECTGHRPTVAGRAGPQPHMYLLENRC